MLAHRYWTGPPSPLAAWTGNAARSTGADVVDWGPLPPHIEAVVAAADGKVRPEHAARHRANVARWALLADAGGWWLDHDVILLTRLEDLPFPATAAHFDRRCTCAMGFPPGHPLPIAMLVAIAAAPASDTAGSEDVSGERLLDELAVDYDDDVATLTLPFDAQGHRLAGGTPWAVHLYAHSSGIQ